MQNLKFDRAPLFLILLFLIATLVVNPFGNFPLNDDWSYARAVYSLVNDGKLQFTGWMSMTLFSQVIWGSIWCYIFGFSHEILRLSTIALTCISIPYIYYILRETTSKQNSFIISLLIVFNPIFFNLSFTFMTDVPFICFSIISIYYFLMQIERLNKKYIVLATIFSVIATLTRQLALIIPLSFFILYLFQSNVKKEYKFISFLPFLITISAFLMYQYVSVQFFNASGRFNEKNYELISFMLENPYQQFSTILKRNILAFPYFILFSLPIVLIYIIQNKSLILIISGVILGTLFSYIIIYYGYIFPFFGNILYNLGAGPNTLFDTWVEKQVNPIEIASIFWIILTFFLFIISSIFILILGKPLLKRPLFTNIKNRFLVFILFIYMVTITSIDCFDRYFLLPFILFLLLLTTKINKQSLRYVLILLAPILFFSIASTHDYLSWNRTRWELIEKLTLEYRIEKKYIDGGFEFNGWNHFNMSDFENNKKNVWVHSPRYVITFNNLPNTNVFLEKKYTSWLGFKKIKVKVLKMNNN